MLLPLMVILFLGEISQNWSKSKTAPLFLTELLMKTLNPITIGYEKNYSTTTFVVLCVPSLVFTFTK